MADRQDPVFDFYIKVFGSGHRDRPPRHYLELLSAYMRDAEAFVARSDTTAQKYEVHWLNGAAVGSLSSAGSGDGAVIAGTYRALLRVSEVILEAELTDSGLRTTAERFIRIMFDGGDEIGVVPGDEHAQQFIDAVLDRIGASSV
jgi:hypothetical protein